MLIAFLEEDTISHILECIILKLEVPEILSNDNIKSSDAFSNDLTKVNTFIAIFQKAWRKREELLDI